jgi:hypothetical protein
MNHLKIIKFVPVTRNHPVCPYGGLPSTSLSQIQSQLRKFRHFLAVNSATVTDDLFLYILHFKILFLEKCCQIFCNKLLF